MTDNVDRHFIWDELRSALASEVCRTLRDRILATEEATRVVDAACSTFVNGRPSVWWHALKHPFTSHPYPDADGIQHLSEHIP